jgi:hypothetical protein
MKHYRIYLAITALVFASFACQAIMGGKDEAPGEVPSLPSLPDIQQVEEPTAASPDSNDSGSSDSVASTDFPMTDDAFNVLDMGNGTVLYYTKMPLEDVMQFYRDEYTAKGYTEREILTTVSDGVFSMVFDGDPSGKAVIIQSVDLGDGSRTVTILFEDI